MTESQQGGQAAAWSGPVSENQHRALLLEALRPSADPPVLRTLVVLPREFDVGRMQAAFDGLSELQESFRTSFEREPGGFVQHIGPRGGLQLGTERVECSSSDVVYALEHGNRFEEIHQRLSAFGRAPLANATLIHCADGFSVLAFSCHHVIFDGVSGAILARQLLRLYTAVDLSQSVDAMRALIHPYREFIGYERTLLSGQRAAQLSAFWREYLKGLTSRAPTSEGIVVARTRRAIRIAAPVICALQNVCRAHGLTLHLALLGCFQLATASTTRECDVLTATPTKNRPTRFANTIGLFMNPALVRNRVDPRESILDNLLALRRSAARAYRHAEMPLWRVMNEVCPPTVGRRTPLHRSWFSIQVTTAPMDMQTANELSVRNLPAGGAAAGDHTLELQSDGRELAGVWTTSVAQDDGTTVRAFQLLVNLLCESPDTRLRAAFSAGPAWHRQWEQNSS